MPSENPGESPAYVKVWFFTQSFSLIRLFSDQKQQQKACRSAYVRNITSVHVPKSPLIWIYTVRKWDEYIKTGPLSYKGLIFLLQSQTVHISISLIRLVRKLACSSWSSQTGTSRSGSTFSDKIFVNWSHNSLLMWRCGQLNKPANICCRTQASKRDVKDNPTIRKSSFEFFHLFQR